jgi:hypothetical protein
LTVSRAVSLTGVLQKQQEATWLPLERTHICRAILEIDQDDLRVVAHGKVAERLGKVLTGSGVQIDGHLTQYRWTTGFRGKRDRLEITADKVTVLVRPRRGMR